MPLLHGTRRSLIPGQPSYYERVMGAAPIAYWPLWESAAPTDYLTFNGTSTEVNCGSDASLDDIPSGGGIITVDGWVRFTGTIDAANWFTIAHKGQFLTSGWRLWLGGATPILAVRVEGSIGDSLVTVNYPVDGAWHHVLFWYNDTTKLSRLALDGVWTSSGTLNGNYVSDAAHALRIGRRSLTASDYWQGDIGWVRVSNNDRFDGATPTNFTPPARTTTPTVDANTVSLWPMNEGYGSVAGDIGANNNDGTITNGSWGAYPAARCLVNPAQNGAFTGVKLGDTTGPDGNRCPYFDGVNDHVNIYSATLNANFNSNEGAMAIWGAVTNAGVWTDGIDRYLINLRVDGDNRVQISKTNVNNQLQCVYRAGGSLLYSHIASSALTFLHIAQTWSKTADEYRVYLNGTQSGPTQNGLGIWAGALAANTVQIGSFDNVPNNSWHGWLSHCAIWDRALSPTEVAALATI